MQPPVACHTAVWTEEGDVFTFGAAGLGRLGHAGDPGTTECKLLPRLVEAVVALHAWPRAGLFIVPR